MHPYGPGIREVEARSGVQVQPGQDEVLSTERKSNIALDTKEKKKMKRGNETEFVL